MRQAIKEIFKFDELDESAKEKAREWYREGALDYDWWEFIYDDAKTIGALFGLDIDDIWFNGFYCQGSGSAFKGSYNYKKGGLKEVISYAPQDKELHAIVKALQDVQRRNFYQATATISAYRDSSIRVGVEHPTNIVQDADSIEEALEDFNHWIFNRLEREYEWLMSDECVDEMIEANGYEFTEDGRHYI